MEAYCDVAEIAKYEMFTGSDTNNRYKKDISKYLLNHENYYYPFEAEQLLIYSIKSGELQKTQKTLLEIYDSNFEKRHLSPPMAKCLIYDLVGTIIKIFEDMNMFMDYKFHGDSNPVYRVMNCKTLMDMKKELEDVLLCLCMCFQQRQKGRNEKIIHRIAQYVKEHYHEEDLSVSQIADKFDLNLSYVSRQFKKHYGYGLYEFINKVRVENAKLLLRKNNCNIFNVATQVGFNNNNSFIRIFKKYEGVTPGRYKNM